MPDGPTPKILLQLDPDPQASVFDAIVAADADVDHLLRHGAVAVDQVAQLVHGTIFTRGPEALRSTAIFIGGSNVAQAEVLFAQVRQTFFGPMKVSVMLDPSGANTTAAAAVLCAERHFPLKGQATAVLGATGPVGSRVCRLLADEGAQVRAVSRQRERSERIVASLSGSGHSAHQVRTERELLDALSAASVIIACGAAGVCLLPLAVRRQATLLKVAIDLNAVPPLGIEGVEVTDKQRERDGLIAYGALGVGGMKMKIHRAAIAQLFSRNDLALDAPEIFALGRELAAQ